MTEWILSSSVLILVVITLRIVFKGKISLRLQYAIWGLVLLRLLIPVSFGSTNISVANLTVSNEPPAIQSTIDPNTQNTHHTPNPNHENLENEIKDRYESQGIDVEVHVDGPVDVKAILRKATNILWAIGFASVAGLFLVTNARFKRKIMDSRYGLGLRKNNLNVYATGEIDTPCLFGIKNPAIYVTYPVADDPTLLRHTLEHEATHHRHGDHIWAVLRCVCLAIHWYNPLVWWAAFLSQRDAELACDEATIKRLGEGERAEYGRTLIGMTCQKKANVLITATTMNSSKGGLKERIMLIAKKPKMAMYTLLIVLLVASIAVGCTFTGAKNPAEDPTETQPPVRESTEPTETNEPTTPEAVLPATEMPDDAPPVNIPEMLHEQPDPDKICIAVMPTTLATSGEDWYYIVPENQELLMEYYQNAAAKATKLSWDNNVKSLGWKILYQDEWWTVKENGAILCDIYGDKSIPSEDAKELYAFCKDAVQEAGIGEPVRPEDITGIISATLYWNGANTVSDPNLLKRAIIVTEPFVLERIETLFSNSREHGNVQCPFTAQLELTLETGETMVIAIATDSCASWMSEGCCYSYGEVTNVGIESNEEFYSFFLTDIIHEKAQEGPEAMAEYWPYMHWGLYANKYGHEETMDLLYMFEEYLLANLTDWNIYVALTSGRGMDGAYAEFYSYLIGELFEAAPATFSFACRQMVPEQYVEQAVYNLAYFWEITPEEARAKLEAAGNQN